LFNFISSVCVFKLKKLQSAQYAKDGQIKMLREKFSQAQAELSLQKQQALKAIEQQTEDKTRREAQLEQDVERLQSQLQFKEHELSEVHGMLMFICFEHYTLHEIMPWYCVLCF